MISTVGVKERQYPSTDSSALRILRYHDQVGPRCKVRAQDVDGDTVWYLLRDRQSWVASRYVTVTGTVRYCKDVQRSLLPAGPGSSRAEG
ncbi:SH3 domain-containing protein [Streptomyces sp. NPDC002004]